MTWWSYTDTSESKRDLQKELARRKAKGEPLVAVEVPKGNKIAREFWGQSWQRHLEGYADYESRLPRGRSYLRQGNVYNLAINEGVVTAQVAGQTLYNVSIQISPLKAERWADIQQQCAGQIGSLLDLLGGKVGDGVLKVITDRNKGLFPGPKEIKIVCDCPDWAGLCKHAAAVLYGIALKFDAEPALFFKLRGVDYQELISQAAEAVTSAPVTGAAAVIADGDISAMFGIEMGDALSPEAEAVLNSATKKPASKPAKSKPVAADDDISAMFGIEMGDVLSPEAEAALNSATNTPAKKTAMPKPAARKAAKKAVSAKKKTKAKKAAKKHLAD